MCYKAQILEKSAPQENRMVDWPSHPVDSMLEVWPADLPRPSPEQIAELRAICDRPVSYALVSYDFNAEDFPPLRKIYGSVRIPVDQLLYYELEPPEDYSVSQADNTGHVIITHLPSSSPDE